MRAKVAKALRRIAKQKTQGHSPTVTDQVTKSLKQRFRASKKRL